MVGVPSHPVPSDSVSARCVVKVYPEVLVQDGFCPGMPLAAFLPSSGFPSCQPFSNSKPHILGISVEHYLTRFLECVKTFNDGFQFHSIVRSIGFRTKHLSDEIIQAHNTRP